MQSGIFILPSVFLLKESSHPILLGQKAKRLRKSTGNELLRSRLARTETAADKFKHAILRPMRMLLLNPVISTISLYVAVAYGILYLLLSTFSYVYSDQYGFDEGDTGLTFLPAGLGMMVGVVSVGIFADALVKKAQTKGDNLTPEVRLTPYLSMPYATVLPAGLFLYGWATEYKLHWIVPMIGVLIFGWALMGIMVSLYSSPHSLSTTSLTRCRWVCRITCSTPTPNTPLPLQPPSRFSDPSLAPSFPLVD